MSIYADMFMKSCRDSMRSWDAEEMPLVPRPPSNRHGTWLLIDVAPISYTCANDVRTAGGVLSLSKTEITRNIVCGMSATIDAIIQDVSPCAALIISEGPNGKLSRRKLFPGYKGKRADAKAKWDETEKHLDIGRRDAIEPANLAYVFGTGVGLFHCEDVEADDALAAYAMGISAAGCRCVIATVDSDLWQCCRWPGVEVVDLGKHSHVKERHIADKYGAASDIPLYKAIVGDASDSIPGVPGLGDVAGKNLLNGRSISPNQECLLIKHQQTVVDYLLVTRLPFVGSVPSRFPANVLDYELESLPF